jgi:hypothetical protein
VETNSSWFQDLESAKHILSNLREKGLKTLDKYPVITTLFTSGIKGIYDLAHKAVAYRPARPGYINKCDLCTEIRTVMVVKNVVGLSECNPREFYPKDNKGKPNEYIKKNWNLLGVDHDIPCEDR